MERIIALLEEARQGLEEVEVEKVLREAERHFYDGMSGEEVQEALILAAKTLIETSPDYSKLAARLLLDKLRSEALSFLSGQKLCPLQREMAERYPGYFVRFIERGVELGLLAPELLEFDLSRLGEAIRPERDFQFHYLGLQILYDRYLLHHEETRFELPQALFMRVAMGLALREREREAWAIRFYDLISRFDYMPSTPTLFNAGTRRPQLSSCYLTTVPDDLEGIFEAIKENALLSKFAGGLGNDWSRVRAMGAHIRGTNGRSQGVIPFLKIVNDTAIAVNQCFDGDTLVYTAEGAKHLKEIQMGDLVLGKRGVYREVHRVMAYPQTDPMVEIEVEHALFPIRVTAGHPLLAITGVPLEQSCQRTQEWLEEGKVRPRWVEAGRLKEGDYLALVIPKEVVPVEGFTEEDARLYGILLGAGHCTDGLEWGVTGNPEGDPLRFVRDELQKRGIPYRIKSDRSNGIQIAWALGQRSGQPHFPFTREELYDPKGQKRIHPRYAHLPRSQTLALVQGLIETGGQIGQEIDFTSRSLPLVEGLRYQLLRLGIPTSGRSRADGTEIRFQETCRAYELRIPAVPELAERVGCRPIGQRHWLFWKHRLWTRVRRVEPISPKPQVFDLEVEGDASYMTTAALAHNGGKRKGAVCAYLEIWHLDIEEFLELRKPTGDERRRCYDMNTAVWVPDLFMKRVMAEGAWTLFSPDEVPDLHELTGKAFEERYLHYERLAEEGKLKLWKRLPAVQLWRKLLTALFETGHPWITFKDPCNLRYPNQHVGVVHSSNLCCVAGDQRVVTDRGIKTVRELFEEGGSVRVVGLEGVEKASPMFLPRPNAPMVRIHTEEGYTHKVTPDHKVWVVDRGWVEAKDLRPGDRLLIQQREGLFGPHHHPDLAFLMGLVAGAGTFHRDSSAKWHHHFGRRCARARCRPGVDEAEVGRSEEGAAVAIDLWERDFDLIPDLEALIPPLIADLDFRTNAVPKPRFSLAGEKARLVSAPLSRLMARFGFTRETKLRVPRLVWEGDRETVSAYLRGLYFAKGDVEETALVLASEELEFLREIQILWANFGVKSSIKPLGRGGRNHRLLITSVEGCQIAEEVTGLGRRRAEQGSQAARRFLKNLEREGDRQKLWATFTHLEELPKEDAFCLHVYSDTHAWTVNGLITKNTEITLHTSDRETAVCNLGSVNLANHIRSGRLDLEKLRETVRLAMRMLDNVIDINYYAVEKARRSNLRHRPVGLGIMGFQDALYQLRIPYTSWEAVEFADRSMEAVSYFAIEASADLARERGSYETFKGSLWSRGILPIDSIELLARERGGHLEVDRSQTMDWERLREKVKGGMRNSNCLAIAPTATIANICGVSQSIEPTFQNLHVKSNLSGEFTVINPYLVRDLRALGLWDREMIEELRLHEGSVQAIDRIPKELKRLYACAFEIDPSWLIEAASRRQKWIDQAQSLNLYLAEPSGKKLDRLYKLAWIRGLKTTYYLRTVAASRAERHLSVRASCSLEDPGCEACQ